MFQMQQTGGGRSQQQGSSLTAQITAQTLGSISNRGYQPNKVIIEQTEESSESSLSSGSSQNSIDKKPLNELLDEFLAKQSNRNMLQRSGSG